MNAKQKLLGGFSFISRTFEARFRENPYVLDADGNLFIGPADQYARDEHVAIEVIYHFLNQTGRPIAPLRELLRNREDLLRAFHDFDKARIEEIGDEFHIIVFGTYDGEPLSSVVDDELPCGPCGISINRIKRRFSKLCRRLDRAFFERKLTTELQDVESRFIGPGNPPHEADPRANT